MDLSILVPSIRTKHWKRLYDSIALSCTKYTWEVVFVGPFKDDDFLKSHLINVRHVHSFSSVPVCMQKATLECKGDFIFHTVDDGVVFPNVLDEILDLYYSHFKEKMKSDSIYDTPIINMRYREGSQFCGATKPLSYWSPRSYPEEYGLAGINQDWQLCLQPLMLKKTFIKLGGFDCRWEYSNHCHHDFMFRFQSMGGEVLHSPVDVTTADHYVNSTGDHEPIQSAQEGPDTVKFREVWGVKSNRGYIDYDNYVVYDKPWTRRFDRPYGSYEEMCSERKYKV